MILDIIFKILCIFILLMLTIIFIVLIISALKDDYDFDKKLKQKNICNIKKQAYREFANRVKNKSLTKWDYNEAVDVEEIDKTLLELIREVK